FIASAVAANAQTYSVVATLDGNNGAIPYGGPVLGSDGNLYGVLTAGGSYVPMGDGGGQGVIYKFTVSSGALTTIYSFCQLASCADGSTPTGVIQGSDGNFYGTTLFGGTGTAGCGSGCGIIFKVTPAGKLTTLHNFCVDSGCPDGSGLPFGNLVEATDGNFYGVTSSGGKYGQGTIFKITSAGTFTSLYSFCPEQGPCPDGEHPYGGLIQGSNGDLYGITGEGGAIGYGEVFSIPTSGGTPTILHSFNQADGSEPNAALILGNDGNLYGTTQSGGLADCFAGNYCGTIFKITQGGTFTSLVQFDNANGQMGEFTPVTQATNGNFYGMAGGGASNNTILYQMTPSGGLSTVFTFCAYGCVEGDGGIGNLVQAGNGLLYGTSGGGSYNDGVIFSLSLGSSSALAVTFSPTSVSFPTVVIGADSEVKTVTVTNSGTATLEITGIAASTPFAVSSTTCGAKLAAAKSCKVRVTFNPTETGEATGTLSLTDNAAGSPQTVALSGTGEEPTMLTPANAVYGKQAIGTTSAAKTFTLTNHQAVELTSITISTAGDFAVSSNTCTASLASKSTCTISVTFTPKSSGKITGELKVSDNAGNSPQISSLSGTGD
ncbi:MAG: choice-of-anchor tandem repeat GloVer-containing protein, partial [Steroidobacteraceae bacterium]